MICDSGGNQQECGFFGIPCLLLRERTESQIDAMRKSVVLSRFDDKTIDAFIASPERYRDPTIVPEQRPSAIAFEAIRALCA